MRRYHDVIGSRSTRAEIVSSVSDADAAIAAVAMFLPPQVGSHDSVVKLRIARNTSIGQPPYRRVIPVDILYTIDIHIVMSKSD